MTNQEMKPNRFLRLQTGKRLFERITETLKTGGVVQVYTYSKAWNFTSKHFDFFKMDKSGSVYMRRGKHWDCIDGAGIRFGRYINA